MSTASKSLVSPMFSNLVRRTVALVMAVAITIAPFPALGAEIGKCRCDNQSRASGQCCGRCQQGSAGSCCAKGSAAEQRLGGSTDGVTGKVVANAASQKESSPAAKAEHSCCSKKGGRAATQVAGAESQVASVGSQVAAAKNARHHIPAEGTTLGSPSGVRDECVCLPPVNNPVPPVPQQDSSRVLKAGTVLEAGAHFLRVAGQDGQRYRTPIPIVPRPGGASLRVLLCSWTV